MPRFTPAEVAAFMARTAKAATGRSQGVEKESELHEQILSECRRRLWLVFHCRMDAPTTLTVGAPDFIILREGGRMLLVEAKARTGKLSEAQRANQAWAEKLGHQIHVVRSFEEFLTLTKTV